MLMSAGHQLLGIDLPDPLRNSSLEENQRENRSHIIGGQLAPYAADELL